MWLANHALKAHQPWLGIVSTPIRQRQKKSKPLGKKSLSQSKLVHMGKNCALGLEYNHQPSDSSHIQDLWHSFIPYQPHSQLVTLSAFIKVFVNFRLYHYICIWCWRISPCQCLHQNHSLWLKWERRKKITHKDFFFCTISSNNDHITGVGTQINICNIM